jgi:hypothetical protein
MLDDTLNTKHFIALAEPVFYFGVEKNKPLTHSLYSRHSRNHLEYILRQQPKNLACHLQRIKWILHTKKRHGLFSALCDLFIILGEQGLALRTTLIDSARQYLSAEQFKFLSKHLSDELMTDDLVALPEQCFFKSSSVHLLHSETSIEEAQVPEDTEDQLATIESYIENSQFNSAEQYILELLNNEPENEALTIKLINLYQALNESEKFDSAYEQFANSLLTSRYWDAGKQYFLDRI